MRFRRQILRRGARVPSTMSLSAQDIKQRAFPRKDATFLTPNSPSHACQIHPVYGRVHNPVCAVGERLPATAVQSYSIRHTGADARGSERQRGFER